MYKQAHEIVRFGSEFTSDYRLAGGRPALSHEEIALLQDLARRIVSEPTAADLNACYQVLQKEGSLEYVAFPCMDFARALLKIVYN